MRVVTCVKRVPIVDEATLWLDPAGQLRDPERLCCEVGMVDLAAVEAALRLRDRFGGTVTVLAVCDEATDKELRSCLRLGADRAVLLSDPAFRGSDAFVTTKILARAVAKLGFDLIVAGARSTDSATGQVVPQLAEWLDVPHVQGVGRIEAATEDTLTVQRFLERGRGEECEIRLPAVIGVLPSLNEPRYARLPDLMRGRRAEIPRWGCAELNLTCDQVGAVGSPSRLLRLEYPRPRLKGNIRLTPGLAVEDRLQQLRSGGIQEKKGDWLEGPVHDTVRRALQTLDEKGVLG